MISQFLVYCPTLHPVHLSLKVYSAFFHFFKITYLEISVLASIIIPALKKVLTSGLFIFINLQMSLFFDVSSTQPTRSYVFCFCFMAVGINPTSSRRHL